MNKYKIERWEPNAQSWEDALDDYTEAENAALAIELAKDYIVENVDENYLDEHYLTQEEFAEEVEKESFRAFKSVRTSGGSVWAKCEAAPVSVNFKVYGLPTHRQRESFFQSERHDFSTADRVRVLDIFNSDRTGTHDFNILRITCETREECFAEFEGQLYDGLYENSKWGGFQVIDDYDLAGIVGDNIGIPFHVYVWDAYHRLWSDSIEDITYIWAETEDNAIQYAIEYMTDSVYSSTDYNEEERAEFLEYWSNPNHYIAELDED